MADVPIQTPAGYAPVSAVGYADVAENLVLVSQASPLPVVSTASAPEPLTGTANASGMFGPFEAVAGRIVTVTLHGVWDGRACLRRSFNGTTIDPLRVAGEIWGEYHEPGCEQAWLETEDGISFYLEVELVSGSIDYRVSQ